MNEMINTISTNVVDNASINVAVMGLSPIESLTEEILPKSEWLQPFLESPINALNEAEYKKTMAIAVIKAISTGALPKMDAVGVASLVDEGMTRLKTAYQIEEGEIDVFKATDILIDHAIIRTASVVESVVDQAEEALHQATPEIVSATIDHAATAISMGLASIYPPAAFVEPIIIRAAEYIKPHAVKSVQKGITKVAESTRRFIKETAPKAEKWLSNKAKSLLNKFFA